MHTSVRARFLFATIGLVVCALLGQGAIAAASITGPDVSGWQHPSGAAINWGAVKADGQSFTFVKATEGNFYQNPYFSSDWSGSLSAGLVRGAYHFARPSTTAGSAVAQANYFVAKAGTQDTAGTLPPVLDLEVSGGLSSSQLITWTAAWLARVQALTGRKPIIYSYPYFWTSNMANTTAFSSYPLWIAGYSSEPGPLGGWAHWTFWQYSSSKYISGISGPGDISTFYGSLTQLRAMALIGSSSSPVAAADPWLQGNDFTGDGKADIGVYRVSTGQWFIRNHGNVKYGRRGDIPVPGDYTGDGRADIAVFRPAGHTWYFRGHKSISYGLPGDIPVPGDYDGSGRVHVAVYRPTTHTWYVRGIQGFHWGRPGDIPVPGNYNGGNEGEDFAVFRPSTGQWFIPGSAPMQYGQRGDEPLPARYDRSLASFPSVWRSTEHMWAVRGHSTVRTGSPKNIPIAADLSGQGYANRIIFNRTNGGWYVDNKRFAYYGGKGHNDIPITGRNIPLIGWHPLVLR